MVSLFGVLLLGSAGITVDSGPPAVLMVAAPARTADGISLSQLLASAASAIEESSALTVRTAEQAGVDLVALDACGFERAFACWSRLVARSSQPPPVALFVLLIADSVDRPQVSLLMLDLRTTDHLDIVDPDALEDAMFERSVFGPRAVVELTDPAAVAGYVRDQLAGPLATGLRRLGADQPWGQVEIAGPAGLGIDVDGRPVGVTREGATVLTAMAPGTRAISVRDGGVLVLEERVAVDSGRTSHLQVTLHNRSALAAPMRYGGLAATAAGVALTLVAVARTSGKVEARCISRIGDPAPRCPDPGFATTGFSASTAPSGDLAAINPPGLELAPLGFSLICAGVTWAVGGWLTDDDTVATILLIAGAIVGGGTYAALAVGG